LVEVGSDITYLPTLMTRGSR